MIPKIIHAAWNDKNILNSSSLLLEYGWKKLVNLNSNWKFEISNDEDINCYLAHNLGKDYSLVENECMVAKTDIWRLLKIYTEGGIYLDIDRFCNVILDDVVDSNVSIILPIFNNYDFSHDLMISEPNNLIFKNTIDMYLSRRKQGNRNIYFLGAQTYMHAITYTLYGQIINTNPGKEFFKNFYNFCKNKHTNIQVYFEDSSANTFLFRNEKINYDLETLKRQFYSENNVKHWTQEW